MPPISAYLLLSKSEYEGPYKAYPEATGFFEDASDYLCFTIFRDTGRVYEEAEPEPIVNGVKIARDCKHLVHPEDITSLRYCPVCEVQICLCFLQALNAAMKVNRESDLRRTWRSARLELEECLEMCEEDSEKEIEWNRKHPDVDISELYTAAKAVRLGREEVKYCGTSMPGSTIPDLYPGQKAKTGTKKTVSFAPDTSFLPKRADTEYQRTNSQYKPGLHAASEDDNLEDASFMLNLLFNLAQMNLYVTTDGDIFDAWEEDPDSLPEKSEGLARLHALWGQVKAFFMEQIESDSFVIRNKFQEDCVDCNVITAQIDDESGEVTSVCLLRTEDVLNDEQNKNAKWTSWKEVMATAVPNMLAAD